MAGKRLVAGQISKWLGSLGEVEFPPFEYFEIKAAQIMGMSFCELEAHPDKARLMSLAFAYERGTAEGEYLQAVNPKAVKIQKERSKVLEQARK